jgi:hypothetical protein
LIPEAVQVAKAGQEETEAPAVREVPADLPPTLEIDAATVRRADVEVTGEMLDLVAMVVMAGISPSSQIGSRQAPSTVTQKGGLEALGAQQVKVARGAAVAPGIG